MGQRGFGRQGKCVAGARAVRKALAKGLVERVLIASDAEAILVQDIIDSCRNAGVEVVTVSSMKELGEFCGLKVGTSACAVLKRQDTTSG